MSELLSRKDFKKAVFNRDRDICVCCGSPAVDAHHIIDRSLWEESQGYFLDNGVAVCGECHIKCEQTKISCAHLRKCAGITSILLPEHFAGDEEYDHWGNIILKNGTRLKGELFFSDNVQKALKEGEVLNLFLPYVKYSRTYHLPDSPNLQNDDRQHKDVSFFVGKQVVATLKMDGENTNLYPDYIHARSIDSKHHESRAWVKALHARIAHEIPPGYRICGENLYAKHSIHYHHLKDYFYVFSIWNEKNNALSWKETSEFSELLNLHTVPCFYFGIWNRNLIHENFQKYCEYNPDPVEGYVVRICDQISYGDFKRATAKWVRKNHVQSSKFWMREPLVQNQLEKGPIYTSAALNEILGSINWPVEIHDFIVKLLHFYNGCHHPHAYSDSIFLKGYINKMLNDLKSYLASLNNWVDLRAEKQVQSLKDLYTALFCEKSELPLFINMENFSEIIKWRLENFI